MDRRRRELNQRIGLSALGITASSLTAGLQGCASHHPPGKAASASLAAGAGLSFDQQLPPGLSKQEQALHLLNRLGFGPRPGDLERVARDPIKFINSQLNPAGTGLPGAIKPLLQEEVFLNHTPDELVRGLTERIALNQCQQSNRERSNAGPEGMIRLSAFCEQQQANLVDKDAVALVLPRYVQGIAQPAKASRLLRALTSEYQLNEVMVDFWFNHFNVFQGKNVLRVLMGHYEHHAIRPFAMGYFSDLLRATAHHPAMLYYLDNTQSVAQGSQVGQRARGLNENYARELMELHTLGTGAYSEKDVTELARILTGWTSSFSRRGARNAGNLMSEATQTSQRGSSDQFPGFWFNERAHDQGTKEWLGHKIAPAGKAEGDFALQCLAEHPATAKHISFKLAQYFVSDQPDQALVSHLAAEFTRSRGHIPSVLLAIFKSPDFWAPKNVGNKFKTPYHYTLSVLRAIGQPNDPGSMNPASIAALVQGFDNQLSQMGMPLYGCATPDGYKNTKEAWLNPDNMTKRMNFVSQVASGRIGGARFGELPTLGALFETLGPAVPEGQRQKILNVGQPGDNATRTNQLTLALANPGMMIR